MKKVISILLVCTMILISTASVFATESEAESYDLAELFADYDEKSLSEMIKFIDTNPQTYRFIEFFYECSCSTFTPIFFIHRAGDNISRIPNVLEVGFSELSPKYLTSTSRVTTSSNASANYDVLMGDVGDRVMSVQLEEGFIEYVNSFDRVERNKIILNLLMNMAENEEIVGISWAFSYKLGAGTTNSTYMETIIGDCNGDGAVNSMDSFIMKITIAGHENAIDPFAVDMNSDGAINAKDSLLLKRKIIHG